MSNYPSTGSSAARRYDEIVTGSELSSCRVMFGLLDGERLEVTIVSADEGESWGERLSVTDTERLRAFLSRSLLIV